MLLGLLDDLTGWGEALFLLVAVVTGAVWLRSSLTKQRHEELEELAETRGQRIEDLQQRVAELEEWKQLMTGKFEALESLKVQQIVDGVVSAILPLVELRNE